MWEKGGDYHFNVAMQIYAHSVQHGLYTVCDVVLVVVCWVVLSSVIVKFAYKVQWNFVSNNKDIQYVPSGKSWNISWPNGIEFMLNTRAKIYFKKEVMSEKIKIFEISNYKEPLSLLTWKILVKKIYIFCSSLNFNVFILLN